MDKYQWVVEVLTDITDFAEKNNLTESKLAVRNVIQIVQADILKA